MANTYLQRTFESGGNRKTWTLSMWVKFSASGSSEYLFGTRASSDNIGYISKHSSDVLYRYDKVSGSGVIDCMGTRKLRDCHGWYNLVFRQDTTQGSADRYRIYINGEQETISYDSGSTTPDQDEDLGFNIDEIHALGTEYAGSSSYFNGSMSHVHFCDGQSYAPTVFGSEDATTGEWKINTSPSVTYGTNGFFILKDGNSVTDQSGESHNFTVGGGTLTKTEDCPSNVFATLNPLATPSYITLSKGNTVVTGNNASDMAGTWGTIAVPNSGKYYWEGKVGGTVGTYPWFGIGDVSNAQIGRNINGGGTGAQSSAFGSPSFVIQNGGALHIGGSTTATYTSYVANDIISLAVDMDNGASYVGKNGTWMNSGDPTSAGTKTGAMTTWTAGTIDGFLPYCGVYHEGGVGTGIANFNFGNGYFGSTQITSEGTNASGNGIFEFDCPNGYTALSTKGLNL